MINALVRSEDMNIRKVKCEKERMSARFDLWSLGGVSFLFLFLGIWLVNGGGSGIGRRRVVVLDLDLGRPRGRDGVILLREPVGDEAG
jgi:hypothetical protein